VKIYRFFCISSFTRQSQIISKVEVMCVINWFVLE